MVRTASLSLNGWVPVIKYFLIYLHLRGEIAEALSVLQGNVFISQKVDSI